jgi:hypothetical protein
MASALAAVAQQRMGTGRASVARAPQSGIFCILGLSTTLIPPRARPTVV